MIDQKTVNFLLPLPHPDNRLEEDVLRLRAALNNLDGLILLLNQATVELPFYSADGVSHPIQMTNNG